MADWLVEEGIGEHRAVRLSGGRITHARIAWPGGVAPGWVVHGTLVSRTSGSSRGTACLDSGEDVLVDRLPKSITEGALLTLEITRSALAGFGRLKRAQGRPTARPLARPSLAETLGAKVVRRFPACDWDELIGESLDGRVDFAGGALLIEPTAAMTTVDVDGDQPAATLALAAIEPLADAVRRFDLGGSVVVDVPSLAAKDDRRAIDAALEAALADWTHERTAMNGFGLVQLVARLERPSLIHLAASRRKAMVWRRLLRSAEALEGAGLIELSIHPSLAAGIDPDHVAELELRTGRTVLIREVATMVPDAPNAQLTPHA